MELLLCFSSCLLCAFFGKLLVGVAGFGGQRLDVLVDRVERFELYTNVRPRNVSRLQTFRVQSGLRCLRALSRALRLASFIVMLVSVYA